MPAFQNFTADQMSLVTPPNSNGWNIPLTLRFWLNFLLPLHRHCIQHRRPKELCSGSICDEKFVADRGSMIIYHLCLGLVNVTVNCCIWNELMFQKARKDDLMGLNFTVLTIQGIVSVNGYFFKSLTNILVLYSLWVLIVPNVLFLLFLAFRNFFFFKFIQKHILMQFSPWKRTLEPTYNTGKTLQKN